MIDLPKTRSQAIRALRTLVDVPRPSGLSTFTEIFPFGIAAPGAFQGQANRKPEDDRGIALIMATVIDQALEAAILSKLPGIEAGNERYIFSDDGAPLRDLDSKIRIAFGLGIFGAAARSDLSLIRSVRNAFAHSRLEISFETEVIAEVCSHFTLPKRKPTFVNPKYNARETFIMTGTVYVTYMLTAESDATTNFTREILDLPSLPPGSK